ncbi:MAG: kinase [Gemmatimonadetes bacterium]|jgi:D-glycero-alpha-D-manno-heptose-7-phosphate kinase|nr:kinase [Gemmatimonadota bacterium]
MSRALVTRAPTRLDFGGGWTDVPPYTDEEGGVVCNIAITRYATATAAVDGHAAVQHGAVTAADGALVRAALRRSALVGAEAAVTSDFPIGAGLGGSSAAGVALAGALAMLAGEVVEPGMLAERSRETEVRELGIAGGFQDHYAAAYGGALLLTFEGCVGVEQLALTPEFCEALTRRGVLVYTGESRISGSTIDAVLNAYRAREERVCAALARMKALARQMAATVRDGDLTALGALVHEHWSAQRALHPSITTPRIDAIMDAASRHGGIGGKALGASGGGCVLVIAEDGREDELAGALSPYGERLDYGVDELGFQVVASLDGALDT